jgi:calcineurin-like phosphoesterase family protein
MTQQVFFTSDTHFGHANVIQYSARPFKDVAEMEAAIVERWNETVGPGDRVYFLGDFALTRPADAVRIARSLNGEKHLIFGNHDKALRKKKEFLDCWVSTQDYKEIKVTDPDAPDVEHRIILSHYPFLTWNKSHHGSWNLHGHCHGSLPSSLTGSNHPARRVDVGVDVWGFRPASFTALLAVMGGRPGEVVDHHHAEEDA